MKDWSVLVNQSKNILTDVLKRAEYLLELHGSVKPSEEADSLDNTDLLMEIMEVREQLEEAQTAEGIESIKQTNKQSIHEVLGELDQKFRTLIHRANPLDESESLQELIVRLRYLKKIEEIISSTNL